MAEVTPDPNATPTLKQGGAFDNLSLGTNTDLNFGSALGGENPDSTNFRPSPDDGALAPQAPPSDNAPQQVLVERIERADWVNDNCLNGYVDVTYGISLAMVSLDAVRENIQGDSEIKSDPYGLSRDQYVVFASTADATTDPDTPLDYYNIQSFSFFSGVGHLPQNPMTAAIWDGKMRIFEPHGFALREDIEKMRKLLGYDPVAPWNFIYRMEIWFSGYNPDTGEWVSRIPIPKTNSDFIPSVVYYLTITTIDAQVASNGTEYQLSFQMYSHKTWRSDALTYRMEGQPSGGAGSSAGAGGAKNAAQSTDVTFGPGTSAPTFRSFIKVMIDTLRLQVLNDTEQRLDITYKVYGPTWLFDEKFDGKAEKVGIAHGSVSPDSSSGQLVQAAKDIDIFTLFYKVMDHLPVVRQLLVQKANPELTNPRVTWNVRTNIQYTGTFKQEHNGYDKYTFEYFIEPVMSFRAVDTDTPDRNKKTEYGNQLARAQNIIDYGMLLRVYDFWFTNDNSEIIDFNFKFKNFYSEPFPGTSIGVDSLRNQSQQGDNPDEKKEFADRLKAQTQDAQKVTFVAPQTSQSLSEVLRIAVPPQSSSNQQPSAYIQGDLYRGTYLAPATQNVQHGEASGDWALYQRSKEIYFRYDMVSANMRVRFDPVWLLNPYMAGGDFTPHLANDKVASGDGSGDKTLYIHTDRVIFIKAFAPVQSDFMNPLRQAGSSRQSPFLGGFYQVLWAVNEFDGGRFTQNLNLVKYTHLNGFASLSGDAGLSQSTSADQNQNVQPSAASPTSDERDPATSSSLS